VVATNMAGRGTDIKLADGLLTEIAINYAAKIKKIIFGEKAKIFEAAIYSKKEYDMFLKALMSVF
jgi:preprotein translocase subunit SecA